MVAECWVIRSGQHACGAAIAQSFTVAMQALWACD
jgi:hypothetical protein